MKTILFSLGLFFLGFFSYSQKVDSLKTALKTAKDTAKVNTLNRLTKEFINQNPEIFGKYAFEAKELAEKINYTEGLATALNNIGNYHGKLGDAKKALEIFRGVLKIAKEPKTIASTYYNIGKTEDDFILRIANQSKAIEIAKKHKIHDLLALCYRSMGNSYMKVSNFPKAYEYFLKGLRIAEAIKDTNAILGNLDVVGMVMDNERKKGSISIYKKALAIAKRKKDKYFISTFTSAIGHYYLTYEILDSALMVGYEALKIAKENGDLDLISSVSADLGQGYKLLNQYDSALKYFNLALEYTSNKEEDYYTPVILRYIGSVYIRKKEPRTAIKYLNEAIAIAKRLKSNTALYITYGDLSEAYQMLENYKQSRYYFKLYHDLRDSIVTTERSKEIAKLSNKYEMEKKEQSIKILEQNNKIKDYQLAQSKNRIILMSVISVLIAGLSILFYSRYRLKKKANVAMAKANHEIQSMVKEKEVLIQEIHHRVKNNLQLVSSLLNWQSEDVTDERFLKKMNEGQSRIKSMAMIHEALYQSDDLSELNLNEYLNNLLNYLEEIYNKEKLIKIERKIEAVSLEIEFAIPLGLIVTEIVSNAFKYAFQGKDGEIQVVFNERSTEDYVLQIKDNGVGLSEEILKLGKSNSMGMQLVKILVKQIKGKLEIKNENGASFTISFRKANRRNTPISNLKKKQELVNQ